jgi:hypothetical protein
MANDGYDDNRDVMIRTMKETIMIGTEVRKITGTRKMKIDIMFMNAVIIK